MALTDTFVKQVKHSGAPAGDKYSDGGGMYLHVTATGKYWRMNYRFGGKQKTLALGVYNAVSLAKARTRREQARELLADGVDPSDAKRNDKAVKAQAAIHTFEAVARQWLAKTASDRAATTQQKLAAWLKHDLYPALGRRPISTIAPRDVLVAVHAVEARGSIDSAHRIKQICGQIFRYAVACGLAERDVTADLKGALSAIPKRHYAAITAPREVGQLLRAIYDYSGHPYALAALKLAPMFFVRPGELRGAEWTEIDLDAAEWRIPRSKMKMGLDHIVPLSSQAVDLLRRVYAMSGQGRYVFPSIRTSEC